MNKNLKNYRIVVSVENSTSSKYESWYYIQKRVFCFLGFSWWRYVKQIEVEPNVFCKKGYSSIEDVVDELIRLSKK